MNTLTLCNIPEKLQRAQSSSTAVTFTLPAICKCISHKFFDFPFNQSGVSLKSPSCLLFKVKKQMTKLMQCKYIGDMTQLI